MTPARLHKKEPNVSPVTKIMDMIEVWLASHTLLCLFVLFALLAGLFAVLFYAMVGVSATDSGVVYNAMNRII